MARDFPPQALREIVATVDPGLLASLDELDLRRQRLARVPRCLAQFAGLRKLDLGHNLMQHLPSRWLASSLPELAELSVRANFLSDVREVQLLALAPKLRALDLRDNSLPGQETPLGIAYHLVLENRVLGDDALRGPCRRASWRAQAPDTPPWWRHPASRIIGR